MSAPAEPAAPVEDLVVAAPTAAGMSAERLDRITAMSQRYVDADQLAGVVTLVARDGKIVHFEAVGQRGVDDPTPLAKDDLFRIYSMSKPITAVAAMMLYEEGKFHLSDAVSEHVPELAGLEVLVDGERVPAEREMTMRQLLTHTTGLSYGFNPNDPVDQLYREVQPLAGSNLDEFAARLAQLPLAFQPGARWHYSVAVDVTGLVVERLSGLSFDVFLKERIFDPLGMEDTFFNVPDEKMGRFLPNHRWARDEGEGAGSPNGGQLVDLGEGARTSYQNTQMFSGGGGLVSTAMDYLRFCEMVRRGGELDGVRLLSPRTVDFMVANHLPATITGGGTGEEPGAGAASAFGFGLGWGVNVDPIAAGVPSSMGDYSWGGAAGTVFWIDPVQDMVVIGMIQLMGSPWPLRPDLQVLANQAIVVAN
ncbi:MAG: serine hydrolase [Gammaproteobacteria bacterium]|nr:serine hydrolase [Gammaproteobacteria bacterium]